MRSHTQKDYLDTVLPALEKLASSKFKVIINSNDPSYHEFLLEAGKKYHELATKEVPLRLKTNKEENNDRQR